jgi:hypothetical protein
MTLVHLVSRRALHRSLLVLVVSFAGLMASGPASAAKGHAVTATCSGGRLCNNIPTFTINVSGAGGVGEGKFTPGSLRKFWTSSCPDTGRVDRGRCPLQPN